MPMLALPLQRRRPLAWALHTYWPLSRPFWSLRQFLWKDRSVGPRLRPERSSTGWRTCVALDE
eukprot:5200092-Pyramimonas_sp.AAC.1